ncbi:MAG: 30S ribosomal protein S8 [Mycoplasmoidaceae bacterium]|nr:30S ribosomal protein S8 [Mycoplasmoidaceae bacterium]
MFMDPISDLISKLNNANKARLFRIKIQTSNLTTSILDILKNEGYITSYQIKNAGKTKKKITIINLKYKNQIPAINGVRQISKPGLRIYTSAEDMPRVLNGLGTAIVTTSHGVMTGKQARKANIGGEVLAYI